MKTSKVAAAILLAGMAGLLFSLPASAQKREVIELTKEVELLRQEVQGLRWGFRAAGAKALVTSLWRSNDVATRSLMHAFYEALASGDLEDDAFRGAEALRRAQLAQVKTERMLGLQRPLTWANFVFSGVL